jgi:hypothetical protein
MPVTIKKDNTLIGTRDVVRVLDGSNIANTLTDTGTQIDWTIADTSSGASGGGAQLLVAAEGSATAAVYNRADYKVTSANNASSGVSNTALATIQNAITAAGSGGSVKLVGMFYLTDTLSLNGVEEFTFAGEGWGTVLSPADNWPALSTTIVEAGQTSNNQPHNRVENLTIDGRQSAFRTGSTINKTIDGITYGSFTGRIFGLNLVRCTGVGLRTKRWDQDTNALTDTIVERLFAACNLGGGWDIDNAVDMYIVSCQFVRNGYDTTDWQTFTEITQDVHGVGGNPVSLQFTGCDFSDNTGMAFRQAGGSSVRSKWVACTVAYNGSATSTERGGLVSTSGSAGQWVINGCVFAGGRGKQLDLTGSARADLNGCTFDGFDEDGVTQRASKALEMSGATGGVVIGCAFGDGYTGTRVTIPTGNRIVGCTGVLTESSGNEAIATATGSRAVNHNLGLTPVGSDFSWTAQFDIGADGRVWISNVTSTQFTLNWSTLANAGTVGWQAEIGLS